MLASSTTIKLKVIGKGGHGSLPHTTNDVITCGSSIVNNLHTIKSRMIESKEDFVFSITKFESGTHYNVLPDDAIIFGTLRTYNPKVLEKVKEKMIHISTCTANAFDCKVEFEINDKYPVTINPKTETDHVFRIAKKYFGAERVSSKDLPMTGSEDFAYYLMNKPGCFYALGTKVPELNYILHSSCMDYNDSMIAPGAYMFVRIIEDRLGVKLLK